MPTVSELMAGNISNAMTNVKTWGGVVYNVKEYGAKGDGVTDDTLAIRKTIANMPKGGFLFFPQGEYLVSQIDSNDYIFKIDRPIKIMGTGLHSVIRVKAGTPATCNLFYISPDMNYGSEFYGVRDILIWPQTPDSGGNVFYIDVSGNGQTISNFLMSDTYIQQHGGKAVKVVNAENKPDGFFHSVFERCKIYGGTEFIRSGDNISFRNCVFRGKNRAIEVKSVSIPAQANYPNHFIIDACNFDNEGGVLLVHFAKNLVIKDCNMEQTSLLNGAVIDVLGDDTQVVNFVMERCHLTAFSQAGSSCDNIRLGNVYGALIDKCTMSNEVGGNNIVIEADARKVRIGEIQFNTGNQIVNKGSFSNVEYFYDKPVTKVKATGVSVIDSAQNFVQFTTEDFDRYGMFDPALPHRLSATIPGKYLFVADVEFSPNADGTRAAYIVKNTSTTLANVTVNAYSLPGAPTRLQVTAVADMQVGEYVQLWLTQASGVTLTANVSFSMIKVN